MIIDTGNDSLDVLVQDTESEEVLAGASYRIGGQDVTNAVMEGIKISKPLNMSPEEYEKYKHLLIEKIRLIKEDVNNYVWGIMKKEGKYG